MAGLFYGYYPVRVTQQEDGTYRWKCIIGREYENRTYSISIKVFIGMAIAMLAFGAVMSFQYHDWKGLLIVAACVAVFLLIGVGVCLILKSMPGGVSEIYWMTDTFIKVGSGKGSAAFDYKRAKKATFAINYIDLKGSLGGPRIYLPEEDMPLVKGYIMSRLPGTAEIVYVQKADLPLQKNK